MVADPESNEECKEEEDDIHNAEREARFEHGAVLVQVERVWVVRSSSHITKWTQVQVDTIGS